VVKRLSSHQGSLKMLYFATSFAFGNLPLPVMIATL
jgi:hypothetical protein